MLKSIRSFAEVVTVESEGQVLQPIWLPIWLPPHRHPLTSRGKQAQSNTSSNSSQSALCTLDNCLYWPALLYESFESLLESIPTEHFLLRRDIFRLKKNDRQIIGGGGNNDSVCGKDKGGKWAMILGTDRPTDQIAYRVGQSQPESLDDFFGMELTYKNLYYSGDDGDDVAPLLVNWKQAYGELMELVEHMRPASVTFRTLDIVSKESVIHSIWYKRSITHTNNSQGHMEEEEGTIWWPALVYDSYQQLQASISSTSSSSSLIFQQHLSTFRATPHGLSQKDNDAWVILFGTFSSISPMLHTIPIIHKEDLLRDYFSFEEKVCKKYSTPSSQNDFEERQGSLSSWKEAYQDSISLIESDFSTDTDPKEPLTTTASSTTTTIHNVTTSTNMPKDSIISGEENHDDQMKANPTTPDSSNSKLKNEFKAPESHINLENEKELPLSSSSLSSNNRKTPRKIPKYEPFKIIMQILEKDYGWNYVPGGSSLVNFYYVFPQQLKVSASYIKKHLIEGKDYFKTEEAFQKYVHEFYGWEGPREKEFVDDEAEIDYGSLKDRVKKRSRSSPSSSNSIGSSRVSRKRPLEKEKKESKRVSRRCQPMPLQMEKVTKTTERSSRGNEDRTSSSSTSSSTSNIMTSANKNVKKKKTKKVNKKKRTKKVNKKKKSVSPLGRPPLYNSTNAEEDNGFMNTQGAKSGGAGIEEEKDTTMQDADEKVAAEDQHQEVGEEKEETVREEVKIKLTIDEENLSSRAPKRLRHEQINEFKKNDNNNVTDERESMNERGVKEEEKETMEPVAVTKTQIHQQHEKTAIESSKAVRDESSLVDQVAETNDADDHYLSKSLDERLQDCLRALNPSSIPKLSIFDGSTSDDKSSFASQKQRMMDFLEKSIKSYSPTNGNGGGGMSAAMYLCGRPGTGKTTLMNHCLEEVSKLVQSSSLSETQPLYPPTYKFVNAAHIQSVQNLLFEIADSLGMTRKQPKSNNKITAEKIEEVLRSKKRSMKSKLPLILVLDEIDMLLATNSSVKNNRQNRESSSSSAATLTTILQWASDPTCRFILIGISNSVGNKDAKKLHSLVKFDTEIIFEPYNQHDLESIITKRLGVHNINLVQSSAIKYVSLKVAKDKGDARSALHIMGSAITKCKRRLPDIKLNETHQHNATGDQEGTTSSTAISGPVVLVPHAVAALRESGTVCYADIIDGLPQTQKIVLCILTTLIQVSPSWQIMSLGQLRNYCTEAVRQQVMDGVSTDTFVSIVGHLEDAGLLKIHGDEFGQRQQYCDNAFSWNISFAGQLDDIEHALGETILKQDFFKRMSNYVKKTNINNTSSALKRV